MRGGDSARAADQDVIGASTAGGGDGACSPLMLLHDSRRDARLDAAATSSFWKNRIAAFGSREQIAEALPVVREALPRQGRRARAGSGDRGPALPGGRAEETDWPQNRPALRPSPADAWRRRSWR